MSLAFFSRDFGALVFGREILKKYPQARFSLQVQSPIASDLHFTQTDFWGLGLQQILQEWTRFGRVGIFAERKNQEAQMFFENHGVDQYLYKPKEKKRTEKKPSIHFFQTQFIHEIANEGGEESVEFRRLVRKYIRRAKNYHIDTIFFPEAIFGADKTRKVLQHLAGSQMKVICVTDFLWLHENLKCLSTEFQDSNLCIFTGDDLAFTHHRAEKILRRKICFDDIKSVQ